MQKTVKKWEINEKGIIRSLEAVMKSGDIERLTKDAYNFTMNISGFIAHYNHGGFMDHYRNVADLIENLERSNDISRPGYYTEDRFFSEGDQAEYYASKARILKAIGEMIPKYKNTIQASEEAMVNDKWDLLRAVAGRMDYTLAEKKKLLTKFNLI